MVEFISQLLLHARGVWRFRWHALAVAWAVALIGWAVVLRLPNIYLARAKVYVDTETVLKPLLSGLAVGSDVTTQVNMMSTVLMSRPHLEKVAHETDLYMRAKTPQEYENLVEDLPHRIGLEAGTPKNTYTITYADRDRQIAQRVVQTLLTAFVEDTIGIKRADSSSAQRFLEAQISDYEKKLRDAEQRLADFKKQNVGLIPGQTGDYYTRLQTEMANLEKIRASYQLAGEKRAELQRQLEGEEPTFGLVTPNQKSGTGAIDARLAELRAKLDNLLLQYTEKHPDVIALRATIAQLEAEKKRIRDGQAAPEPAVPSSGAIDPNKMALHALDINPVYQATKIALGQTEVELVELRSQLADAEARVRDLKAKVNTIPEVEAELAQLNRDYDVNRKEHTELLQRLEAARLSQEAEQSSQDVKFKVIEPALALLHPVAPNRPLLLTAVLLLALAAGIGFASSLNMSRPVFSARGMLQAITGLKVIGSISLTRWEGKRWATRQSFVFVSSFVLLVFCYAATLVVAQYVSGHA
jgi:polysaccharide chain length determinant protein (PEP-CTERM system associated)